MPRRTISWSAIDRAAAEGRPKIAPGLIVAKSWIEGMARVRGRPLVVAGRFDRAAIMAAATDAARRHQDRFGCTWGEAMAVCLTAAWRAAKLARHMAAH